MATWARRAPSSPSSSKPLWCSSVQPLRRCRQAPARRSARAAIPCRRPSRTARFRESRCAPPFGSATGRGRGCAHRRDPAAAIGDRRRECGRRGISTAASRTGQSRRPCRRRSRPPPLAPPQRHRAAHRRSDRHRAGSSHLSQIERFRSPGRTQNSRILFQLEDGTASRGLSSVPAKVRSPNRQRALTLATGATLHAPFRPFGKGLSSGSIGEN